MKKLKFFLVSLCMIFAFMACEVEPSANQVEVSLDPITIKSRAVTLDTDAVYSVSHDGKTAISSTGIMYDFDSNVSNQKAVFKAVATGSEQFIGFEGEGLGTIKFSMAATKDELFKKDSEKGVKSNPTWKEKDLPYKLVGRIYSNGDKEVEFSVEKVSGPTDPKRYFAMVDGEKYNFVKAYSPIQGWWKNSDTKFYAITITEEGKTGEISGIALTTNEPTFTGTAVSYRKANTEDAFLAKIKGKTAGGLMGRIPQAYEWTEDGKTLLFGLLPFPFEESSSENTGVYGGMALRLLDGTTNAGSLGDLDGLSLTFGPFSDFVKIRVTEPESENSEERIGRTAKGKSAAGTDITYTWSNDGVTLTVVDGGNSVSHTLVVDSGTSVVSATYGDTVLTLEAGYSSFTPLTGTFGELEFTFD